MATGSRRYRDPTLIVQLGPKVTELVKEALVTREGIVFTIQTLIILCTWPVPFDSLGSDISPVLTGAMLQLSMIVGLHVYGVGQDFSRTKLENDPAQRDHRTRLWAIALTTYQRYDLQNSRLHRVDIDCFDRAHMLTGTPGLHVTDMYDYDDMQDYISSVLPPSVYFQRKLSKTYVESILDIERRALKKNVTRRNAILGPMIDEAFLDLMELQNECPGDLGKRHLYY